MTSYLGVLFALLFRHLFVPLYYTAILEMKRITTYCNTYGNTCISACNAATCMCISARRSDGVMGARLLAAV